MRFHFFRGARMSRALEAKFQADLIKDLEKMFPHCVILKNDPTMIQGIPDLCILFGERWAMLEVKASEDADVQPNQEHYVGFLNRHSFAAFIYPENKTEVLDALQLAFIDCW